MKRFSNNTRIILAIISIAVVGAISGGVWFFSRSDELSGTVKISDEFMNDYLDAYAEMNKKGERENILVVMGDERPDGYGAIEVVDGPNGTYFLMYESAEARDRAYERLETDERVSVEKNTKMELMDYNSWGIAEIGLDGAREQIGYDGALVKVAVIDTGLDVGLFRENYPDVELTTYDVENDSGDINAMIDAVGHGTHVAGTVAEGAPMNLSVLAIKASTGDTEDIYSSDVTTAIYKAASEGANVINMSLGSDNYSAAHRAAIEYAKGYNTITVAAAGNESSSTTFYPAGYDNTLSISAVNPDLSFASYSNYGDTIDFAAPGTWVTSINGMGSGTSMASPHVAAVVATLKSLNSQLSFEETKNILIEHARDLGAPGKDTQFGYGLVDLKGAEFCVGDKYCDEYGVFAVGKDELRIDDRTVGEASIEVLENGIELRAEHACVVLISNDGGETYERVSAATVPSEENTYRFEFEITGNIMVMVALKGDGDLDGEVSPADLNTVNRSLISPTLGARYRALTDLEKTILDLDGDGMVTPADLNTLNRSLISPTLKQYKEIGW